MTFFLIIKEFCFNDMVYWFDFPGPNLLWLIPYTCDLFFKLDFVLDFSNKTPKILNSNFFF